MTNYTDQDITFFMGLYQDLERATGAIECLRQHFPEARLVVRSDGDSNSENRLLAERFQADYREEERCYPIQFGGAMIRRIFQIFLEQPTPYLLKLDTDTATYRRFRYLPERSGAFGTLQSSKQGCASIQGGFTGFSLDAVQRIQDSGILDDARLRDPWAHREESGYFDRMGRRVNRTGLCSFDWIIGWVATELNIPMIQFDEVHCRWLVENNVRNENLEFAMTHPVYFDRKS